MLRIKTCIMAILLLITASEVAVSKVMLIRVSLDSPEQVDLLSSHPFDFASRQVFPYADIVAHESDLQRLSEMGFDYEILESDPDVLRKGFVTSPDMGAYHTYQEMVDELERIAQQWPQITHLTSIGKSIEGREIWAIKVSDNPKVEEPDEPGVLYLANMHGREIITPEIILYFLNYLVEQYSVSSEISNMVDHRQLWLIPTLNPDGHVQVELGNRWWRKNRRINPDSTIGVDLNRNFGYKWGYDDTGSSPTTSTETYRGTGPFSEPESQAIRELVMQHHFVAALSYHSYGRLWLYPWSHINADTPHHAVFQELARNMIRHNGYVAGNPQSGTIYLVNGDTDDYFYGEQTEKNMIFGFTPEVGETFFPWEEDIAELVQENLEANIYLARVAGILAKDPRRIFKPPPPLLQCTAVDDDGGFRLYWSSQAESLNAAKAFDLESLAGYHQADDDAEGELSLWGFNRFSKSARKSSSGNYSYYSGTGSYHNASMTMRYPVLVQPGQSLRFKTWYELNSHVDYAYIEISVDNGTTFHSISGNLTTDENLFGKNSGHGITGSTDGQWREALFDLSAYAGKQIFLRLHCIIDGSSNREGIYIDDIGPVGSIADSELILSGTADTTFILLKAHPGSYAYRVRAIDEDLQMSGWSNVQFVPVDFGHKGDVNQDQRINEEDIRMAGQISLGARRFTNGEKYRSDMDESGEVDILDVLKLVKMSKDSHQRK